MNGSITERVEFKTYGKLPDSYSKSIPDIYNYNCTISNFSNGRSYTWDWVNETIMIDSVYISYSYPFQRFWSAIRAFIILASYIGVNMIIVIIVLKIYKRIKSKRIKSTE